MLYEELKLIEKLLEGDEYFDGGVTYCIGIEKYDENVPISISAKRMLMSMNVTSSIKNEINVVRINDIENELQRLCAEWHFNDKICSSLFNILDEKVEMYSFCEDYEYIAMGNVGEIFRILKRDEEIVCIDFYIVD